MKILFYGLNLAPESTGIPKYSAEMTAWLAAAGHTVEAIAGMPHYPAWKVPAGYRGKGRHEETVDGVRVTRIPLRMPRGETVRSRDRILLESSFVVGSLPALLRRCRRRHRYDVVVSVCPPLQTALPAWLFARLKGIPWVLHVQDLQVDAAANLGMIRGGWFARALFGIERFLFRKASAISTITEAMRERIVAKGVAAERVWLVPNWADLDHVRPAERLNGFREQLGFSLDTVIVGFAGSLGEKHGLDDVLRCAQLLMEHKEIRFAIIGEGTSKTRLLTLAEELELNNVVFLPMQPREALPEVLAAIDIHLVPQQARAADTVMPSKLTNIFAAGRPTLATSDAGTTIEELLVKGRLGTVCKPDDPAALAEAVVRVAEDAGLRAAQGSRARLHAERCLGIEGIMAVFNENLTGITRVG